MTNKIIGLIITSAVAAAGLAIALSAAGAGIGMFLSIQSLIWVLGIAGGLTYMKYNKDGQKDGLFPVLKGNLIFAGYIGALVGLVISFGAYQQSSGIEAITAAFSASLVTLLYGYFLAYILEPFSRK